MIRRVDKKIFCEDVVFKGNEAIGRWIVEDQYDGFFGGRPEYYFIGRVSKLKLEISSGVGYREILRVLRGL